MSRELNFKVNNFWKLWFKYWWDKKLLSIFCILTILIVSLISVFNIFIAKEVTSLLIADTFLKNINDHNLMLKFIEHYFGNDPNYELIKAMLISKLEQGLADDFINTIIHDNYFASVFYANGELYTVFFGFEIDKIEWLIILVSSIIGVIIFMYTSYTLCGTIAESTQKKLNNELIDSIFNKPISFFQENKHEDIISKITKDSNNIVTQLKVIPIIILYIVFSTLASIGMLVYIDAKITLYMGLLLFAFLLIAVLIIFLIAKPMKENLKKKKRLYNNISEKVFTIRLVKSNGNTNTEIDNFEKQIAAQDKDNKKNNFLISLIPAIIIGAIGSLALASMIVGVFVHKDDSSKLITVFSSFTAGIFVLVTPIFQLNTILQGINDTNAAVTSIGQLLNSQPKTKKAIKKNEWQAINKIESIVFKDISLQYNEGESYILKDLNFAIVKGKKYAFVGESGSGKSTVARLLLDFYQPTSGTIEINGFDLKRIEKKNWLSKLGYVDQEPEILSGSFIENLRYIVANATEEEIMNAYKKAKLHDYIMSLNDGYDTILYERGKQLSGGQKQRLVLARLFLKQPELIILDEATSALDNLAETEIQKEIDILSEGRTVIAIAHRLITIKDFDKIFVLKDKKIVEAGSFEELINQNGEFKKMYQINSLTN